MCSWNSIWFSNAHHSCLMLSRTTGLQKVLYRLACSRWTSCLHPRLVTTSKVYLDGFFFSLWAKLNLVFPFGLIGGKSDSIEMTKHLPQCTWELVTSVLVFIQFGSLSQTDGVSSLELHQWHWPYINEFQDRPWLSVAMCFAEAPTLYSKLNAIPAFEDLLTSFFRVNT